jgi:hypothetical protein
LAKLTEERISALSMELFQVHYQLLRDQLGIEASADPRGVVRAAYGEAAKRVYSAAIALVAATSVAMTEKDLVIRQLHLPDVAGEVKTT